MVLYLRIHIYKTYTSDAKEHRAVAHETENQHGTEMKLMIGESLTGGVVHEKGEIHQGSLSNPRQTQRTRQHTLN